MTAPTQTSVAFVYTPADPPSVTAVPTVALYPNPARSGTPTVTGGPTVRAADGSTYRLTLPAPDGTYWPAVTVTYADGTSEVDRTGPPLSVPAPRIAETGDPLTPWVTVGELQRIPALAPVDTAVLAECAQAATEVLWALSGRQFSGPRYATVRLLPSCPCGRRRWWPAPEGSPFATGYGHALDRGVEAGYGSYGCGCGAGLLLPRKPVRDVLHVSWHGTVLTSYEVEDDRLFVTAPSALPLAGTALADKGLVVTLSFGQDPPAAGRRAARALAAAYAKGQQRGGCGLPSRTTSVAAEGVTVLLDDLDTYRKGGTGVTEADAWVASVNPGRVQQPAGVLSPDSPRWRTR